MAILRRFTPLVQPVSIDEASLGRHGLPGRCSATGETIARRIKDAVHDEVGLTASVGVATTKLVAKIRLRPAQARRPGGRGAG